MEFKRRRELKRTKIEIIPMIDTIFFLLVFFMLSSLALVRLKGLPVNLPNAVSAQNQNADNLTVTIDRSNQIYVNKVPVALNLLGQTLVADAGPNADLSTAMVIINADKIVPNGLVVACIDASRLAGINNFAIATAPEASSNAR